MRDAIQWRRKWPHVNDGTPSPGNPGNPAG